MERRDRLILKRLRILRGMVRPQPGMSVHGKPTADGQYHCLYLDNEAGTILCQTTGDRSADLAEARRVAGEAAIEDLIDWSGTIDDPTETD